MPKVLKEISFLLKLIKNLNHHMKTDIDWKLKIALDECNFTESIIGRFDVIQKIQAECTEVSYCRSQRLAASSLKRQGRGNCEEYCHAIL